MERCLYKDFFLLVTRKTTSCLDVGSIKSRIQINMAEGLAAGWMSIRDKMGRVHAKF